MGVVASSAACQIPLCCCAVLHCAVLLGLNNARFISVPALSYQLSHSGLCRRLSRVFCFASFVVAALRAGKFYEMDN